VQRLALHAERREQPVRLFLRHRRVEALVVELVAPRRRREAEDPVARELVGVRIAAPAHLLDAGDREDGVGKATAAAIRACVARRRRREDGAASAGRADKGDRQRDDGHRGDGRGTG
jgi:hypothetical protein